MVAFVHHDAEIPGWAMDLGRLAVERARGNPAFAPELVSTLERGLPQATHVHAQNVADYVWVQSEREYWDPRFHVADARCPWRSAWITYRRPPVSNDGGVIRRIPEHDRYYVGVLHRETVTGDGVTAHSAIFITARPERGAGSLWETITVMNPQGVVTNHPTNGRVPVIWHGATLAMAKALSPGVDENALCQLPLFNRTIALMTCALANCKNVEAVERTYVPHSKKVARRTDYKGRRYYVLGINPLTAPRSARQAGEEPSSGVSYHICRGHFADYTQGNGLFGRHHGRFWVPQHARGSRAVGEVVKDYAVAAPVGGAA